MLELKYNMWGSLLLYYLLNQASWWAQVQNEV